MIFTGVYIFVVFTLLYAIWFAVAIIRRRHTVRQYVASVFLFLSTAIFIVSMVQHINTKGGLWDITIFYSKIPFGNLFLPFETEDIAKEFRPLFYQYFIVTAAFSVFWGFFVPFFQKSPTYFKLILLSSAIWIPVEILFWFMCSRGYSGKAVFDTGCFIVLLAGFSLGYGLYHLLYGAKQKPAKAAKGASA